MNGFEIREILSKLSAGQITVDEAEKNLKMLPFEDIDFAKIDHHRKIRNGFPEVIFCLGKTVAQVKEIFVKLTQNGGNILATRATKEMHEAIVAEVSDAVYFPEARIIARVINKRENNNRTIAVISAGTSDIPVAEEAAITAEVMGNQVIRIYDVGVAGIHRLFGSLDKIFSSDVIIVVAGMEGALASVVGGIVDKPVVAVPTSIGYGTSFGGVSALLTMLNSCASGIGVVNIDNGFGAACLAVKIAQLK